MKYGTQGHSEQLCLQKLFLVMAYLLKIKYLEVCWFYMWYLEPVAIMPPKIIYYFLLI